MYAAMMETSACARTHSRYMCVHLKKNAVMGHTIDQTLLGLSIVVFLLVDHYLYYESPGFSIIKSFSTLYIPLMSR
jgi:hypothetical protein